MKYPWVTRGNPYIYHTIGHKNIYVVSNVPYKLDQSLTQISLPSLQVCMAPCDTGPVTFITVASSHANIDIF